MEYSLFVASSGGRGIIIITIIIIVIHSCRQQCHLVRRVLL